MATCIDRLGPGPDNILCSLGHCVDYQQSSAMHSICNCQDFNGNRIPNCDPKDNLYPVQSGECYNSNTDTWEPVDSRTCGQRGWPWYFRTCYCCCSCFASSTPVADPQGFKAIGDYNVGDQVLTAFRTSQDWTWQPETVQFSSGSPATTDSGPTAGNLMLMIEYGEGKSLIATPNQLFAVADGKLKRADQLAPGDDSLVGEDGSGVSIGRISSGYYKGPVHHIATDMVTYEEFTGSLDGHLINTNGVVAGDYLLQLFQDTPKMAPNLDTSAPTIGTPAYQELHANLVVKPYVVGADHEVVGAEYAAPEFFTAHGDSSTSAPAGALSLFTERQEAMLLDPDIPKRGFSDSTNMQQVSYFTTLLSGFFPDVEIVMDWESVHPNVYGYQADGKSTVLIGGELLRLGPLYGPAMAIAIGFGVAAATSDQASLGRALYDGTSWVLVTALGPYWAETVQAGLAQFSLLLTALAGKETSPTDEPGLGASCLLDVINAAVSGDIVPSCAGGDTLALSRASYTDGAVQATFNTELAAGPAGDPANYAVSPGGTITRVELNQENPTIVTIRCDLAKNSPTPITTYVLTVLHLTGLDGSTLNPLKRSAAFKVS